MTVKKRGHKLFYGAVSTVFLVLASIYLYHNLPELSSLPYVGAPYALALLAASVSVFVLLGQEQRILLKFYNTDLSQLESFTLVVSNNFLNYFPAKAGIVARGIYFRTTHGLPLTHYTAATISAQLIHLLIAGIIGATAGMLLIQTLPHSPALNSIIVALSVLGLASAAVLTLARHLSSWLRRTNSGLRFSALADAPSFASAPKPLTVYSTLIVFTFLLMSLRLWLSFDVSGIRLSALHVLLIQTAAAASIAFSVLPGNIGIREGVIVAIGAALGLPPGTVLTAALLDRLSALAISFTCGPLFISRLIRRMQISQQNRI